MQEERIQPRIIAIGFSFGEPWAMSTNHQYDKLWKCWMIQHHVIESRAMAWWFIWVDKLLNADHPHLCENIAAAAERFNIDRRIVKAGSQAQFIFSVQLIQTCDSASRYVSSLKVLAWGSYWWVGPACIWEAWNINVRHCWMMVSLFLETKLGCSTYRQEHLAQSRRSTSTQSIANPSLLCEIRMESGFYSK